LNSLNATLSDLIQNGAFISDFEARVKREEQKGMPFSTPLEIFADMTTEIDSLTDAAAVLINLEPQRDIC